MRFAKARQRDIANGPGIRTSLWVCGCTRHCKGCFQPELWEFGAGKELTESGMLAFRKLGMEKDISGYSILGGEPLQQGEDMVKLLSMLKDIEKKTIWIWTGYVYEELTGIQKDIADMADMLVDGPYIDSLKCPNRRFKGSSNQRIIDMKETLAAGHVVLSEFNS